MNKRDELLLDVLDAIETGHRGAWNCIVEFRHYLESESQPAAPTSGAGDACRMCQHGADEHPTGRECMAVISEWVFCACSKYTPTHPAEPQLDGADDLPPGTWEPSCTPCRVLNVPAAWKALAKRYRAERDFLTGKSNHYERLFHFTADELADLRRAAPDVTAELEQARADLEFYRRERDERIVAGNTNADVTAAVEAERARVRDIWVSDNGNLRRPNIAELEEILAQSPAPARPATAVKDWPEWKRRGSGVLRELAQPATVGERKLAARWSKGVGAMATCDTCRRPRPIAYWRYPGAFTCCADCAEKAGVFATHKAAPIATPPATRLHHPACLNDKNHTGQCLPVSATPPVEPPRCRYECGGNSSFRPCYSWAWQLPFFCSVECRAAGRSLRPVTKDGTP